MFHCEWGRKPIKNKSFIIIGCQRIFSFLSKQDPFDLLMYHAQWSKKLGGKIAKNKWNLMITLFFLLIMKDGRLFVWKTKINKLFFGLLWIALLVKHIFRAVCVRENLLELLECLWLVINRTLRLVLPVESNLKIPHLELTEPWTSRPKVWIRHLNQKLHYFSIFSILCYILEIFLLTIKR